MAFTYLLVGSLGLRLTSTGCSLPIKWDAASELAALTGQKVGLRLVCSDDRTNWVGDGFAAERYQLVRQEIEGLFDRLPADSAMMDEAEGYDLYGFENQVWWTSDFSRDDAKNIASDLASQGNRMDNGCVATSIEWLVNARGQIVYSRHTQDYSMFVLYAIDPPSGTVVRVQDAW